MELTTLSISGLLLIRPKVFSDARGLFFEAFQAERYHQEAGLSGFVQDNISVSSRGSLRGLHYQVNRPQGKLVQVLQGKVWDVAVDIRQGSPTFGQWEGIELDSEHPSQFYIPPGFAHGFQVLSDQAIFHYKCTDIYSAPDDRGVLWCDEQLAIPWPLPDPVLSPKDQRHPRLRELNDNERRTS